MKELFKKYIYCIIFFIVILVIAFFWFIWPLIINSRVSYPESEVNNTIKSKDETSADNSNEVINFMKIKINDKEYIVDLENNETVRKLVSILPLDLTMSELNGNEKYVYLDKSLPTNSSNPKKINAGDVMLFGDNCLVVFYKSFDTSYSYTKIGHIDNLPDLGSGNIDVKIEG